ncbi:MAG: hypothetical protein ACRBM6_11230 [Geminicoccales bacterium]
MMIVLLLAAFAAGTIVQSAQATFMDVEISVTSEAPEDGCGGCFPDTNGDAMTCVAGCVVPLATSLPAIDNELSPEFSNSTLRASLALILFGRSGQPDPFPPRTIDLT